MTPDLAEADGLITYAQITEAIDPVVRGAGLSHYCAQTGGGTATIIVGDGMADRGMLAIGPGSYDWDGNGADSTFWLEGLCAGLDSSTEDDATYVSSLEELAEAVRVWLQIVNDEDDDGVLACEFCRGDGCQSCAFTGNAGWGEDATAEQLAALALRSYNRTVRKNGPVAVSNVARDESGEAFSELMDRAAEMFGTDQPLDRDLSPIFDAYQAKLRGETVPCPLCGAGLPLTLDENCGEWRRECQPCDLQECGHLCGAWVCYSDEDMLPEWAHLQVEGEPEPEPCFMHQGAPRIRGRVAA